MASYLRVSIRTLGYLLPLTLLLHCAPEPASAPEEVAVEDLGPVASMIRNPVDRGEVDTVNVAMMTFLETTHEFGEVTEGKVIKHDFEFTNNGNVPLLITDARSTCGCTVPSYPKAPIPPGASGVIAVAFDTKNKKGGQQKPVIITANTYPAITTIYVTGRVDTK